MVKPRKRPDSWRMLVKELERYYRLGYDAALDDLLVFCSDFETPLPNWATAALADRVRAQAEGLKPKKKLGRHASHRATQLDHAADIVCYQRVLDLRRQQRLTWVQAYEAASVALRVPTETVHKAYTRAKKSLTHGKEFYWSDLYGDGPTFAAARVTKSRT